MFRVLKNKKAQAILEMAIVFPVITVFLFFAFDYSKVVVAKWETMNMARTGVRVAVMKGVNATSAKPVQDASTNNNAKTICSHAKKSEKGPGVNITSPYCISAVEQVLVMRNEFLKNTNTNKGVYIMEQNSEYIQVIGDNYKGSLIKEETTATMPVGMTICMDVKVSMKLMNGHQIWQNKGKEGKPKYDNYYRVCSDYHSFHSAINH